MEREAKKAEALKAKLEEQMREIKAAEELLEKKQKRSEARQRKHVERTVRVECRLDCFNRRYPVLVGPLTLAPIWASVGLSVLCHTCAVAAGVTADPSCRRAALPNCRTVPVGPLPVGSRGLCAQPVAPL